jgi:hypothetical protein
MKVSGFTFIRNAVKFDYPIVEAITSILPVCDEFVVAAGNSDDDTDGLLASVTSPKLKIIHTVWDDTLREGGRVLAEESDKALRQIAPDADWAFYIQGDEVVHEKYLPVIVEAMKKYSDDGRVEGLLFNFLHFYGSYDYVGDSRRWYRREVRVVRPLPGIHAYRDAQGFRHGKKPLKVKAVDAWVYHYGWVKPPAIQQAKQKSFNRYWHDDDWVAEKIPPLTEFDYSHIDSLTHFEGIHPAVMKKRIEKMNWTFDFDPARKRFPLKTKVLHGIERMTGWRIGEYKNFKIIKG